jgi:hypothetical protein
MATANEGPVRIHRIDAARIMVPIVGTSPLIVHAWSAKARKIMLDRMQGSKPPKTVRDPAADYEESLYRTADGGYGFPALGFKNATVSAVRLYGKALRMTEVRAFLFFEGVLSADKDQKLVPVEGVPHMREDAVRVGMTTDLRYRGQFDDWRATLDVTYVRSALDSDSVLSLISAGGLAIGVGEWRPEKDGQFGTYRLDNTREIEEMR